jgi:Cu-Zn family superoxide dismutase
LGFVPFGNEAKEAFYVATSVVPKAEDLLKLLEEEPNTFEVKEIWSSSSSILDDENDKPEYEASVRSIVCNLPVDKGQSGNNGEDNNRYHYEVSLGSCKNFKYLGQGGNLNNFKTYTECADVCGRFKTTGRVAEVKIQGQSISGTIIFSQASEDDEVAIFGTIEGLDDGLHGFHIHAFGNLSNNCAAAGGHFNPFNSTHGSPDVAVRHVGDLGNILAEHGKAEVHIRDKIVTLYGENSILDRAVVLHSEEDDLGLGGDDGSLSTGNAGARLGCGLIVQIPSKMMASVDLESCGIDGSLAFSQEGPYAPVKVEGIVKGISDLDLTFTDDSSAIMEDLTINDIGANNDLHAIELELAVTLYGPESIRGQHIVVSNVACGVIMEGSKWPQEGVAMVRGPNGVKGRIRLVQESPDAPVQIIGTVIGLTQGKHGFHIHEHGATANKCKDAGGHYNPFDHDHSGPTAMKRHVGDLGNVEVAENHAVAIDMIDEVVTLHGPHSVLGRSIVIHAGEDDLGNSGDPGSLKTGNAGARVACGIIQPEDKYREVISARAVINNPIVKGQVNFVQEGPDDWVHIEADIFGLEAGHHGFHIHSIGSTDDDCKAAGGHFNPYEMNHGGPHDKERHAGDIGNIETNVGGNPTNVDTFAGGLTLKGENSAIGRAVVIHASEDDLGQGGDDGSLKTGNAGARIGCAVIRRSVDYVPDLCKLPPVNMAYDKCPYGEPAWTYDATFNRCMKFSHGNCKYATENRFNTEQECMDRCPVDPGL